MKTLALAVIQLILLIIVAQAMLSWLIAAGMRNDPLIRVYQTLNFALEPLFRPLRRVLPPMGMFDFTPIAAIFVLFLLRILIIRLA